MKIKKNPKKGIIAVITIITVALILLLIVNIVPNTNKNTFNAIEKYIDEDPLWKNICYAIVAILMIIAGIVDLVMCRCNYCGKHIKGMDIFTNYCPYCSKSLDVGDD